MIAPSAAAIRAAATMAALLAAAAVLSACGTAHPGSANGAATTTPSPSHHAGTSTPTITPTPSTSASLASCATSALKASVDTTKSSGAAGSIYYPLDLTNVSGTACTLAGYPGVAFVSGPAGALMGRAASRNPVQSAAAITLMPGQAAHAMLQVAEAGNFVPAQCVPVTAHWLQVYPPDQASALFVPFTTQACSARLPHKVGSQLSVSVVQPGLG
ncbi:MAG TPA: DUF4232 domain-containing protein [Streptosporangiaceae bacterium]